MFGCGGVVMIEPGDGYEASDGGAPSFESTGGSDLASGGAGGVETPVCDQPVEPVDGWAAFDAPTFDCCVARIASILPEEPAEGWPYEGTEAADRRSCCAQIVGENYEEIWGGLPLEHAAPNDVVAACCISAHGNPGCSPWGPPMPVAMAPEDWLLPTDLGLLAPANDERWGLA